MIHTELTNRTFTHASGQPFDLGLQASARLKDLVPAGATLAQLALSRIIDQHGASVVIPGAQHRPGTRQHRRHRAAADRSDVQAQVTQIYDDLIRAAAHDR
jgi:aryl-alcohol dehydrogenase-like predicted oxidoreductase